MALSQEFNAILNECQDAIMNADFDQSWTPPATASGTSYNCQLVEVANGAKPSQNGKSAFVWIKPVFRITDGEFAGQEFGIFYSTLTAFKLGPLFSLVTMATKDSAVENARDLRSAVEALTGLSGRLIVQVTAKTKPYTVKKGPNTGEQRTETNFQYDRVIDILRSA